MDGRGRKGDGRKKFSLFILVCIYNIMYNLLCGGHANDKSYLFLLDLIESNKV